VPRHGHARTPCQESSDCRSGGSVRALRPGNYSASADGTRNVRPPSDYQDASPADRQTVTNVPTVSRTILLAPPRERLRAACNASRSAARSTSHPITGRRQRGQSKRTRPCRDRSNSRAFVTTSCAVVTATFGAREPCRGHSNRDVIRAAGTAAMPREWTHRPPGAPKRGSRPGDREATPSRRRGLIGRSTHSSTSRVSTTRVFRVHDTRTQGVAGPTGPYGDLVPLRRTRFFRAAVRS
jgi:hypothetical protein